MPVLQQVGDNDSRRDADGHLEHPVARHFEHLFRIVQAHQQHQTGSDGEEEPGQAMWAHLHGNDAQHRRGSEEETERELIVEQPPRHDETQQRSGCRSCEPQHAAAQRAGARRHQGHEAADRRPPGRFELEHQRQRGGEHYRAGSHDALARSYRILAKLAELAPTAVDRLRDHVADLREILAHFPGEARDHRKMTVRASAPM